MINGVIRVAKNSLINETFGSFQTFLIFLGMKYSSKSEKKVEPWTYGTELGILCVKLG